PPKSKLIHEAGGRLIHEAGGRLIHEAGGRLIHETGGRLIHETGGRLVHEPSRRLIHEPGRRLCNYRIQELVGYGIYGRRPNIILSVYQKVCKSGMLLIDARVDDGDADTLTGGDVMCLVKADLPDCRLIDIALPHRRSIPVDSPAK